jgi:hypothetical protein
VLRPLLILVVTAALVAGVVVGALAVTKDDDPDPPARTSPVADETLTVKGQFSLEYPPTWRPVPKAELGAGPVAGLRRDAGDGQMVIQRGAKSPKSLQQLEDELTTRLKRQLPDFKLVRSTTTEIAGERSLSYTFVRTKTGQAQNLTIIPSGNRTYTLSSVLAAGENQAATEVAGIVKSFKPL